MNQKDKQNLRDAICNLSYQIFLLEKELKTNNGEQNQAYNKLLIERAKLRQEYKDVKSTNVISIIRKKFQFKKQARLINDYFN